MKPPRSQYTLAELMGLVALCAMGFAMLMTPLAPFGACVLFVIPGFVVERARGGTGIIGGMISGCLIPMGLASLWAAIEYLSGFRSVAQSLDFFPALYLLFVICLVCSSLASSLIYLLDRGLQGQQRQNRLTARIDDTGIRYLTGDDGPGSVREADAGSAAPAWAPPAGASDR